MHSCFYIVLIAVVAEGFRSPLGASSPSRVLKSSTQEDIMQGYLAEQRALQRERRELRTKQEFFDEMNSLIDGTHGSYDKLTSASFWDELGRGMAPISSSPGTQTVKALYGEGGGKSHVKDTTLLNGGDVKGALDHLKARGYSGVEEVSWNEIGVNLQAIADTMEHLKASGWPPVFVLMFDETWRMLEGLFEIMEPIMGEGCELEASLYGWALEPPTMTAEGEVEKVGGNFGQPHRDFPFDQCHLDDGETPSVVSVWIPMVQATLDNGCMYVVPREMDPLFDRPEDKYHLTPTLRPFPYAHVRPLNTGAGTVLIWNTCTIHWGSACSPTEYLTQGEESRKSIAMSFRVPQGKQAMREKEWEQYGRLPFTKSEIQEGVPLHERLKLCIRGLMMYSVWHPEFNGFERALITA